MSREPGGGGTGPPREDPGATRTSHDHTLRLPSGTLLAERYRLGDPVGVGAMGVVYRARDERLDLDVAVKVLRVDTNLRPQLLERFRKELILARQVTHRNAVRIHDIGQDGEIHFLTMDLVEGRSLREILDREGRLSPELAESITRQLASALGAAHAQGVVHRDLKPENVLLNDSGEAFITDFGVARSMTAAGMTRTGAVVGTLDYLSPEQARGEEVDGRSDLFSLGILLFEMLTGELPFPQGTGDEVLAQRLAGAPRRLSDTDVEVPPRLRRVAERCLQRSPARRYPTAGDLLEDLQGAGTRPLPPGAMRRALTVAGALLLAVAIWWLVDLFGRQPTPSAGVPSATAGHAVAVLPPIDETNRPDLAWLPTGVAEMLAATLAESSTLRVVDSRRVVRTLEDLGLVERPLRDDELRQLATVLDADRLVIGRLRPIGEGLRADLELLAADLPDLPATSIRAEVAAAGRLPELVEQLAAGLLERLEVGVTRTRFAAPDSTTALRAYSEGVRLLEQGDAVTAAPRLEEAVEAAPGYAPAWMRLAEAYDQLGYRDRAVEASRRAVEGFGAAGSRQALTAQARAALLRGDPEDAQRLLTTLVERFPNDVEARVRLAESLGDQGELERAMEELRTVARVDPNHPRAWYLLGKYAILGGDSRRAIDEYLVHALVVQNKLESPQGRADVLNAMGVAYHRLGELDRAAEQYAQAAELRRQVGDRRGYATSLGNQAAIDVVRGRFDEAEEALGTVLATLDEIGDRAGVADTHNELGLLEEERGDYAAALDAYRRALQLRRELGDEVALAESLTNVGYVYHQLGEYDNASVYWQQAHDLHTATGNEEGILLATQNMGMLRLAQGSWNEASSSLLEALESARQLRLPGAIAVSQGYLGQVAFEQGRYRAAAASLAAAQQLVDELGDPRGQVEFALLEARLAVELGMQERAEQLLSRAEEWLETSANRSQRARLGVIRGDLALARGRVTEARALFRRAAEVVSPGGGVVAALQARLGTARAARAAGDAGLAVSQLRQLVADVEGVGHSALLLEAEEELAAAYLATGEPGRAAETLRRALRRADSAGSWRRAFRLHHLLGRALQDQDPSAAAEQLALAQRDVERQLTELTGDERESFLRRPEVAELMEEVADERAA